MLYTEQYYLTLIYLTNGYRSELKKPELTLQSFLEDWLQDKMRIWSSTLEELITKTEILIGEINQSLNYQFVRQDDIIGDKLETEFYPNKEGLFPKRALIHFEKIILRDKIEELHFIRRSYGENLINSLKLQVEELKSCLEFYEKEKESKIFEPEYPKKDRIPYQGGERSLAFFISLLIEGGFILGPPLKNDDQIGINKIPYFNDSVKDHIITKEKLASAVSKSFYCVHVKGEKLSEGSTIQNPNSTNLRSKMQVTSFKDLGDIEKHRIQNGFDQIKNILNPKP